MAKKTNPKVKKPSTGYRKPRGGRKPQDRKVDEGRGKKPEELDETRSNNPSWYFTDEKLADQVTQLSFQQLAGYPINYDGTDFDVPNIVRIGLNPAPGVQLSKNYNTALSQNSAINLAGFRLYSKLSSVTGRVATYAPQDVSTMILAMGEAISMFEYIRRAFGVAYSMNMRNRDYPRNVLEFGMCIDADDLFANFADYVTEYNKYVTLFNQVPIPKNVAYFDKCAKIYERIYLDANSSMAQTLVPVPYSTWVLDETSYSGGSILKTTPVTCDTSWLPLAITQNMSVYLNLLGTMVSALLNSSSLQVVYTDILNYAVKQTMEFWKMDYYEMSYQVFPEYDENFLLQMHNATIAGWPSLQTSLITGTDNVTPLNDVYPDPNKNSLFYNPCFAKVGGASGVPRTGNSVVIDMLNDSPSLTDRVEVTRYTSISNGKGFQPTGQTGLVAFINTTLPDHYVTSVLFENQTANLTYHLAAETLVESNRFADIAAQAANIDWAPRFWEVDQNTHQYTGRYTGDINFYTTIDDHYLRKIHDFVGLALYDVRQSVVFS